MHAGRLAEKLREIIQLDGRPLIPKGYKPEVSKPQADEKVSIEIGAYRHLQRLEKDAAGASLLSDLVTKARQLASEKRAAKKK